MSPPEIYQYVIPLLGGLVLVAVAERKLAFVLFWSQERVLCPHGTSAVTTPISRSSPALCVCDDAASTTLGPPMRWSSRQ